jgi:hypothetical protein
MSLNYSIMAQSAEDFLIFQKSPLIYLRPCIQIEEFPNLLDHVSIYTWITSAFIQGGLRAVDR